MESLKQKKLFLLDMDGTIYIDTQLFDGTIEFLEYIRQIGGRYMFVTNNSSKSVDKYIEKLASLGIEATADDFLTSTNATIAHLKRKNYKKIYAFGTQSFRTQLEDAQLPVTTVLEDDIDCLCMGFDTELTFQKLEDACKRKPLFIGKPQPAMVELALEKTGFKKEEAIVIGDRLYTDIACGVNAGISSAFVLSGEGTLEDIETSEAKPQFVFNNIKELFENLK